MPHKDMLVLGAGIVGTSIALHLAKRGLAVALIDRGPPGEATSYGNAGIIEGNTVFPPAFPSDFKTLLQIALKRGTIADYHLSFLPQAVPWLMAFRRASQPAQLVEFARAMRPLFARAVAEHEALAAGTDAAQFLRKSGWLKLFRDARALDKLEPEFDLAARYGVPLQPLDVADALALEPSLNPVFRHAVLWPGAASVSNPLELTRAYLAQFVAHGGVTLTGNALTLRRSGTDWQVDTEQGPLSAEQAVVALGPWAPDLLRRFGIDLPLGIKRGYHLHFHARGNAGLSRPVIDADIGYCLAPMQQGIRLTTGAEIAARDAPPTPGQLARLLPSAHALFPLGEAVEREPWLGCRPCFPDSRPVIGPAPGQAGLWLAIGHAHWGLTLGPATGRLIAEMVTGAPPFCDPAPYRAVRFS